MDNNRFNNDWQTQRNANIIKEYEKLKKSDIEQAKQYMKQDKTKTKSK